MRLASAPRLWVLPSRDRASSLHVGRPRQEPVAISEWSRNRGDASPMLRPLKIGMPRDRRDARPMAVAWRPPFRVVQSRSGPSSGGRPVKVVKSPAKAGPVSAGAAAVGAPELQSSAQRSAHPSRVHVEIGLLLLEPGRVFAADDIARKRPNVAPRIGIEDQHAAEQL